MDAYEVLRLWRSLSPAGRNYAVSWLAGSIDATLAADLPAREKESAEWALRYLSAGIVQARSASAPPCGQQG